MTSFPNTPNLLVVVERSGKVVLVNTNLPPGSPLFTYPYAGSFLNLTDRVHSSGNFEGLTGFAFDPRYSSPKSRWIYAYYNSTNADGMLANQSRVERFWVPISTPQIADKSSAEVIWENEDATCVLPTGCEGFSSAHVSGQIHFSPDDGKLYIGVPDHTMPVGPAYRQLLSQNLNVYWGKLLRISAGGGIPQGNPLFGMGGVKQEILACGLRNPYGFSFDSMTGDLWIGDVGHQSWEEINFMAVPGPSVTTVANYGWPCLEATDGGVSTDECSPIPTTESPFAVYSHLGTQHAVLGGYVYRGTGVDWDSDGVNGVDGLELRYFFADYITNQIWSVSPNDIAVPVARAEHTDDLDLDALFDVTGENEHIWGFGRDSAGELYVIKVNEQDSVGTIYRIEEE